MPAETVRAFVALPCTPALRRAIEAAVASWRETQPAVRWTDPDRMHLTLRFLGDAAPDRLDRLDHSLRSAAAEIGPIDLDPASTGAFPGWHRPRILWLGVSGGPALARLAEAVEAGAQSAGFDPEERDLTPHLTLGRVKDGRDAKRAVEAVRCWEPRTGVETVTEMVLYRSDLGPLPGSSGSGPRHTSLARYPLAGERPS